MLLLFKRIRTNLMKENSSPARSQKRHFQVSYDITSQIEIPKTNESKKTNHHLHNMTILHHKNHLVSLPQYIQPITIFLSMLKENNEKLQKEVLTTSQDE